jgi:hypothetical protein
MHCTRLAIHDSEFNSPFCMRDDVLIPRGGEKGATLQNLQSCTELARGGATLQNLQSCTELARGGATLQNLQSCTSKDLAIRLRLSVIEVIIQRLL